MPTATLPPASYSGPSGGLKKPSVWLASEDLGLDVEKIVTILDVELHRNVKFEQGRTEEKVGALKFAEIDKHMILNSTNRKMLVRLFGMDTKAWRNKVVALYVDPDVKMAGQRVNGLRIRPAPEGAQTATIAPPQAILTDLPEYWDVWTDEERGVDRAGKGTEALKAWWATLTSATRLKLATRLVEWKAIAEKVES